MDILKTKDLTDIQRASINRLWNEEFPVNLKGKFSRLLEGVDNFNHYLIEDDFKNILAWAVSFEKDFETRFSIIVSSKL